MGAPVNGSSGMPGGLSGSGYLVLMNDQSRRARDFEHRLRWLRLQQRLADDIAIDYAEVVPEAAVS